MEYFPLRLRFLGFLQIFIVRQFSWGLIIILKQIVCVCVHFLQSDELDVVHDPAYTWSGWQEHIPGRSLLTIASVAFSHP